MKYGKEKKKKFPQKREEVNKNMMKHKQELFKKLQNLGMCFGLIVAALIIASAWTGIADSAGLISKTATGTADDGVDESGNTIPGAKADDHIDDSTQQLNYFITSIIQWITGFAGAILGLGIVFIAIMHAKEDDPNKKD